MNSQLFVPVSGQGLYDITSQVVSEVSRCGIDDGLVTLFIQHTSASLLIQENADPAVQTDLHNWLNRSLLQGFSHRLSLAGVVMRGVVK